MRTKIWAVFLVLFCTLLTSSAQILWKKGSAGDFLLLFFGFALYGIAAVFLIIALKNGELSVLYPFIATSFIWVSFLSVRYLGEGMNGLKWIGIVFILVGVSFIGLGSKNSEARL